MATDGQTDGQTETLNVEEKKENASDLQTKRGKHARTVSEQMLASHAVEEDMLKQMKFAVWIVKYPCCLCISFLVVLIVVMMIDGQFFALSENSNRSFLVEGDEYVDAFDAYSLAAQFVADNTDENVTVLPQTESQDFWIYSFYFQLKDYKDDFDADNPSKTDYWILTPENIEKIIEYEDKIYTDKEWIDNYCYVGEVPLETNYSCRPALNSAARDVAEMYNYDYSLMTTESVKEYIADNIEYYFFYFNPYVAETGQSYIYRSFLKAGAPIATGKEISTANGSTSVVHITEYLNSGDEYDEQEQIFVDWATKYFVEITVDNDGDLIDDNLEIMAVSWSVYNKYFAVLLNESMIYLIFAVIIVFCYMSFHLQSIFLSACALFQILMSFPLAYFVYRLIFQIPHYDTLSSLIIFVLLGVGADDVFVFTDAWLQSVHFVGEWKPNLNEDIKLQKEHQKEYEITRMSFAYRRAAKAMLVTQLTTFFAFLATASSPIIPIKAFGIWAATIVFCNYLLVITLYPAVLIIHHRYIKKYEMKCLCCCCNTAKSLKSSSNIEVERPDNITRQPSVEEQANEYRRFERFLGTTYAKFIHKYNNYCLILFFCLFILGAILGAQMEAQSEDERWFADEHYMQQVMDIATEFSASESDALVQLQLTWGIKGVNRDGTSAFDPDDYGKVVWDSSFDPSSPAAQSWLYSICNRIRASELTYNEELVTCPIDDWILYLDSIGESFPYIGDTDTEQQSILFASMWNDFLSDATYGASTAVSALSYADYDDDDERYYVKFFSVYIYSRRVWTDPADISRSDRAGWDTFIKDITDDSICPVGICNHVNNVSLRWCWLVTQTQFVRSAIQGILIAMPLAFIILLISTQNYIVSIFAVADIIGIMLCELTIMQLQGWKFGVSECVAIVIIIGFSVDYVVHLANAYLESTAEHRMDRLSFSLLTMGISVVSGAVTTGCAGAFLIFPSITFFKKMGILMVSTVCLSIFWAMCFFTAIISKWGPEHNTGDIKILIKNLILRCKGEYVEDEDEKTNTNTKKKDTYSEYTLEDGEEQKPYSYDVEMN